MHKQGKRCIGWGWQDITTKDVDPTTSQGDAYQTFGWATQLAEVEVDTDTGFVQVTRLVSATDAGRAINPMGVEGQVQGGAVMGLGYALYEQHVVDNGRARTGSLAFYLVPTPLDVPEIECLIVEVPDPERSLRREGRVRAGHDPDDAGDPERDLRRRRCSRDRARRRRRSGFSICFASRRHSRRQCSAERRVTSKLWPAQCEPA